MVEAGRAYAASLRDRLDRRARRRQLARLRQGHQLRADQRRHDARLPRARQGVAADAAVDRRADDGRHRQRGAVVRADLRRRDARQDGLRRSEGGVPRRDPRSGADRVAAASGHRRRRLRRDLARGRVVRHRAADAACRISSRARPGGCSTATTSACWPRRTDLAARGAMLLGAHEAGIAIEQSMLGATHACANPLTARYGTTHGIAIAVMLPHVVRWNAEVVGDRYAELLAGRDGSRRVTPGDAWPRGSRIWRARPDCRRRLRTRRRAPISRRSPPTPPRSGPARSTRAVRRAAALHSTRRRSEPRCTRRSRLSRRPRRSQEHEGYEVSSDLVLFVSLRCS